MAIKSILINLSLCYTVNAAEMRKWFAVQAVRQRALFVKAKATKCGSAFV